MTATSPRSPTERIRRRKGSTWSSRHGRRRAGRTRNWSPRGARRARAWGGGVGGREPRPSVEGVRWVGSLPADDYRALLRRARVYLTAPRREDFGIAQLEALADGCMLVTAPAPGSYAALPLARALDPRLVSRDLAAAVRAALDDPAAGYADRAAHLLEPYA